MEAISMAGSAAVVDLDRCIGCGLCVTACPEGAARLIKKEKDTVPPKDMISLYKKIMIEKLGPWGSIKMIGKMLMGQKI
jgi:Fe-S-cluster-containing hydrogenase component 2